MTLSEFLEELNLTQYLTLFEENGVDYEVLETLTESELKEIGIRTIGHRRKILIALERTMPIRRIDLIPKLEEKEIFRGEHEGEAVLVTSHRVSLGEEIHVTTNIEDASVYTHVIRDTKAERNRSTNKGKAIVFVLLGMFLTVLSAVIYFNVTEAYQFALLAICATLPGCVFLILGLRLVRVVSLQSERFEERYYLRLQTAAGQRDVFSSLDKKELDPIAQAIRQSITWSG